MPPRPVWARRLRRLQAEEFLVELAPPTEAEKHDAILVLEAFDRYDRLRLWSPRIAALVDEAERIFLEASE